MVDTKITDLVDAGGATALDYLYIVDGATSKHVQFDDFEGSITHDNLVAGTIASHDTTATGAQCTSLTDGSDADALHAHAVNDAKNTNVSTNITIVEAPTNVDVQSSDGSNDTIAAADVTNAGVMTTTMYDEHVVNTAHAADNTQAHSDYLINSAADTGVGLVLTGDNASADTQYTAQVLYNTDSTPPAASGFPIGTLYVQYTA